MYNSWSSELRRSHGLHKQNSVCISYFCDPCSLSVRRVTVTRTSRFRNNSATEDETRQLTLHWLQPSLSLSLILRATVSRPVYLGIKPPSGAHDQIFICLWQLRPCFCGRPLWREDGSDFCICCTYRHGPRRKRRFHYCCILLLPWNCCVRVLPKLLLSNGCCISTCFMLVS
jgi:hypothetical protein